MATNFFTDDTDRVEARRRRAQELEQTLHDLSTWQPEQGDEVLGPSRQAVPKDLPEHPDRTPQLADDADEPQRMIPDLPGPG